MYGVGLQRRSRPWGFLALVVSPLGCPFCADDVTIGARLCPHCRSDLRRRLLVRASALLCLVALGFFPHSVAAETLGPAGGTGGDPARSGCGTMLVPAKVYRDGPHMVIGVAGRSGNWLDQIRAICMRFTGVNGVAIWKGDPAQGTSIGGQNGQPFEVVCPRNQVVVALRGRAGSYVDRLQLACQHFTDRGRPTGRITWLSAVGGGGGDAFGPLRCAANGAVQFLSARGRVYVDSVSLECTGFQFDFKPDPE